MTMKYAEPGLEPQAAIDALTAAVERYDLGADHQAGTHAGDVGTLLDNLSKQFLDYRTVVAGVRDAVRRNAEMLTAISSAAVERGSVTGATAEAITAAGHGALQMSDDAALLHSFSQSTGNAVSEAGGSLEFIDGSLGELSARLAQTESPLTTLSRSTEGVADFVGTLARLSRRAQMLAVNASIEAAHLGQAGARLAHVAAEIRKLSVSTHESQADVATIVGELRETSRTIAVAVGECRAATSDASLEIAGAGEALGQTATGIEQFEEILSYYQTLSDSQSAALEAIGSSVDLIAYHSDEAADLARVAEHLNLEALLDRAQERAGRLKLRTPQATSALSDTDFGRWIGAICAGADAAAPAAIDDDADFQPLVAKVRSLMDSLNAEQREILGDVVEVAAAIALNGYAWHAISCAFDRVGHEIIIVRATVAQWVNGVLNSVDFATGMRAIISDSVSDRCDAALTMLDEALRLIARTDETVRAMDGSIELLNSAASRGGQIMELIDELSSETDLLSLNAAIEAEHAGSLGFGVIAQEIRSLAGSTKTSSAGVSELVSAIEQKSGEFRASIVAAAKSMKDVVRCAADAHTAVRAFRGAFDSAMESAADLAIVAAEQKAVLDRVSEQMDRCAQDIVEDTEDGTAKGRLELAIFGARAHAIAARRPIGTVLERVRVLGETLCVALEAVLETAILNGEVSLDDLFNFTYREIEGDEIAALGRLFDVSRVPLTGFKPPKYATSWDAAVDEAAVDVLTRGWDEATAAAFAPVNITATDLNGFVYASPRQHIADWTDTPGGDNSGNIIKRVLSEDEYTFRVVRWGLGPHVEGLGSRCTYEQFRDAGCHLDRTIERSWGAYVYARTTQLVCNELVMGLYVRGMRHGTLRLAYDPNLR